MSLILPDLPKDAPVPPARSCGSRSYIIWMIRIGRRRWLAERSSHPGADSGNKCQVCGFRNLPSLEYCVFAKLCFVNQHISSPCISVRGNSRSSVAVHFVLADQWVMICLHSGVFAPCRVFCCDSVATEALTTGIRTMASGAGLTCGAVSLT